MNRLLVYINELTYFCVNQILYSKKVTMTIIFLFLGLKVTSSETITNVKSYSKALKASSSLAIKKLSLGLGEETSVTSLIENSVSHESHQMWTETVETTFTAALDKKCYTILKHWLQSYRMP